MTRNLNDFVLNKSRTEELSHYPQQGFSNKRAIWPISTERLQILSKSNPILHLDKKSTKVNMVLLTSVVTCSLLLWDVSSHCLSFWTVFQHSWKNSQLFNFRRFSWKHGGSWQCHITVVTYHRNLLTAVFCICPSCHTYCCTRRNFAQQQWSWLYLPMLMKVLRTCSPASKRLIPVTIIEQKTAMQ